MREKKENLMQERSRESRFGMVNNSKYYRTHCRPLCSVCEKVQEDMFVFSPPLYILLMFNTK